MGASDVAMGAMSVSRFLWLFWPYTILIGIGFFLLKGPRADDVRSQVVVFTGSLVLGSLLCTLWLALNMNPGGPSSDVGGGWLSYTGTLLTVPLLWRVIPIMAALALHSLIYAVSGLFALPRTRRNRVASALIGVALVFGVLSPLPQVRFWRKIYTRAAMAESRAAYDASLQKTDRLTEEWAGRDGSTWEEMLLRANFLHAAGRTEEARQMDRRILELPAEEVPAGLRSWIQKRQQGGGVR